MTKMGSNSETPLVLGLHGSQERNGKTDIFSANVQKKREVINMRTQIIIT